MRAAPVAHDGALQVLKTLELSMDDFMHVNKFIFPPGGSATTPPHRLAHPFKFKVRARAATAHHRTR